MKYIQKNTKKLYLNCIMYKVEKNKQIGNVGLLTYHMQLSVWQIYLNYFSM